MDSLSPAAIQVYQDVGNILVSDYNRYRDAEFRDHFQRSREAITQAIEGLAGTALILGAGTLLDIPAKSLAETFTRIILIDINSGSEEALASLSQSEKRKFTIVKEDLTGILGELSVKVETLVAYKTPYDQFVNEVIDLLPTLRRRVFDPKAHPSFVCSSMLASQIGPQVERYLQKVTSSVYKQDFNPPPNRNSQFEQFIFQIQINHINDLKRMAGEKGKIYFADHFSARTILRISNCALEMKSDEKTFPRANEVQSIIKQQFNTLRQQNWTWTHLRGEMGKCKMVDTDNKYLGEAPIFAFDEYSVSSIELSVKQG